MVARQGLQPRPGLMASVRGPRYTVLGDIERIPLQKEIPGYPVTVRAPSHNQPRMGDPVHKTRQRA